MPIGTGRATGSTFNSFTFDSFVFNESTFYYV